MLENNEGKNPAENEQLSVHSEASRIDEACLNFLSSISHEIRTPLNSAVGFASLLSKTSLSEQQTEFLNYIKLSHEIISKLSNDIIDFARIQAGNIELSNEEIDLRRTVREVFSISNVLAFKQNVILTYSIDERLKHAVIGDQTRLKQVLLNLMSAALKTLDKQPPASNSRIKLEIAVQYGENETLAAAFSIKTDKGPPENPNGIQNCEFSLLLSNLLVKLMNKNAESCPDSSAPVSFSRNDNGGISLSFNLFFRTGKSFHGAAAKSRTSGGSGRPAADARYRILIVDDDQVSLELTRIVLKSHGHEVALAANGLAAVELCKKNSYDIILMDSHMPTMNGFEATAALRKNGFANPIIALTASVMNEDRSECAAAGMNGFITKPIDPDSINSSILELVAAHNPHHRADVPPMSVRNFETSSGLAPKTFNRERFYRNVSGKPRIAKEIVRVFFESYHKFMDEIRDAILNSNSESLWRAAHRMKGTAINVGAETISALFSRLEELGRKNYISGYQHILNAITNEIASEYEKYRFEVLSHSIMSRSENEL